MPLTVIALLAITGECYSAITLLMKLKKQPAARSQQQKAYFLMIYGLWQCLLHIPILLRCR